ncbi:hypothetical protein RHIZ404_210462 [Rhizobium sp. EC-SD404]|nr:hypothetical protein RHIZ404_210462 [Rhizobium sp. EC-SD404]
MRASFRELRRWSGGSVRTSGKLLFVKSGITGIGIVEDGAALGEAVALIDAPSGFETGRLARFENETEDAAITGKLLDLLQKRRAHPLAAHLRLGEHALHFPETLTVIFQRRHADSVSIFIARDENRHRRIGHLLDGQLELELARRQRDHVRVERADHVAHVVLERRLGCDSQLHGLLHDFRDEEEPFFGRRRVGHDIGSLVAIGDDIGALLHVHGDHRGHGLDATHIDLVELLDEAENDVELADHALCILVAYRETGQTGNALHGCDIDRHAGTPGFSGVRVPIAFTSAKSKAGKLCVTLTVCPTVYTIFQCFSSLLRPLGVPGCAAVFS